jgi:hypothetical protein
MGNGNGRPPLESQEDETATRIANAIQMFLDHVKVHSPDKPKTHRRYRKVLEHLERILGKRKFVEAITRADIDDYKASRSTEKSEQHPGRQITPRTINFEVSVLRTFFNSGLKGMRAEKDRITQIYREQGLKIRSSMQAEEAGVSSSGSCWPRTNSRYSPLCPRSWPSTELAMGFRRCCFAATRCFSRPVRACGRNPCRHRNRCHTVTTARMVGWLEAPRSLRPVW